MTANWLLGHPFVSVCPIQEENGLAWWFFIGEIVCFCGKPSADCACHTMWHTEMATATMTIPFCYCFALTCLHLTVPINSRVLLCIFVCNYLSYSYIVCPLTLQNPLDSTVLVISFYMCSSALASIDLTVVTVRYMVILQIFPFLIFEVWW